MGLLTGMGILDLDGDGEGFGLLPPLKNRSLSCCFLSRLEFSSSSVCGETGMELALRSSSYCKNLDPDLRIFEAEAEEGRDESSRFLMALLEAESELVPIKVEDLGTRAWARASGVSAA